VEEAGEQPAFRNRDQTMPKRFTVSDGKLILFLEPAENGWYAVASLDDSGFTTAGGTGKHFWVPLVVLDQCLEFGIRVTTSVACTSRPRPLFSMG
jgi:hypothetical protein